MTLALEASVDIVSVRVSMVGIGDRTSVNAARGPWKAKPPLRPEGTSRGFWVDEARQAKKPGVTPRTQELNQYAMIKFHSDDLMSNC
jgi:hypothetical protein